jgi:hypothetical protein
VRASLFCGLNSQVIPIVVLIENLIIIIKAIVTYQKTSAFKYIFHNCDISYDKLYSCRVLMLNILFSPRLHINHSYESKYYMINEFHIEKMSDLSARRLQTHNFRDVGQACNPLFPPASSPMSLLSPTKMHGRFLFAATQLLLVSFLLLDLPLSLEVPGVLGVQLGAQGTTESPKVCGGWRTLLWVGGVRVW